MSSYVTDKAYIDCRLKNVGYTFDVLNPFSGEVIGKAADCDEALASAAIESAKRAFGSWKSCSPSKRSDIFHKWTKLILSEKQSLAELITLENGKPIAQSVGEIEQAASFVEWYSHEGRRTCGKAVATFHSLKKLLTLKQPIGVVAMVTPWNYPAAMVTRKACAALAAGCTVVIKPSEEAPFSALALALLCERAGIPPGVLNVIPTSRKNVVSVGKVLCTSPSVAALSFTGSTATGKILLHQAASSVKKVSLELGGQAPLIVFDSADLKKSVYGTMTTKFRYSGQRCVSSNRILVQSGIHDHFVSALKLAMENELVMGDGMDPKTTIGPLINAAGFKKVCDQLKDALNQGAKVILGGSTIPCGRNMFAPTLITNIKLSMKCFNEETFGPLLPIFKFDTEEEAIKIANGTTSGLASYVFSGDVGQCWRVSEKLEAGIVGINEGSFSVPEAPFGGVKESGLGREGSTCVLDEYMIVKHLRWGI